MFQCYKIQKYYFIFFIFLYLQACSLDPSLFDEELNKEAYKHIGIKTLKPFKIKNQIKSALEQLSSINEQILSNIWIR